MAGAAEEKAPITRVVKQDNELTDVTREERKRERESLGDMEEQVQTESRIRRMVLNHIHI